MDPSEVRRQRNQIAATQARHRAARLASEPPRTLRGAFAAGREWGAQQTVSAPADNSKAELKDLKRRFLVWAKEIHLPYQHVYRFTRGWKVGTYETHCSDTRGGTVSNTHPLILTRTGRFIGDKRYFTAKGLWEEIRRVERKFNIKFPEE